MLPLTRLEYELKFCAIFVGLFISESLMDLEKMFAHKIKDSDKFRKSIMLNSCKDFHIKKENERINYGNETAFFREKK